MARKRNKHLTGQEIAYMMREQSRQLKETIPAAFTGMAAIVFRILMQEEKFSAERIAQYNERLHEYYEVIDEYGQEELDLLIARYNSEFKNEKDQATYREQVVSIPVKGNALWMFERNQAKIDNLITQEFDKFMLCHLNTLLDLGISKKRVQCNRHKIVNFIENEMDKINFNKFVKELEEEYGIVIEMPNSNIKQISFRCKSDSYRFLERK